MEMLDQSLMGGNPMQGQQMPPLPFNMELNMMASRYFEVKRAIKDLQDRGSDEIWPDDLLEGLIESLIEEKNFIEQNIRQMWDAIPDNGGPQVPVLDRPIADALGTSVEEIIVNEDDFQTDGDTIERPSAPKLPGNRRRKRAKK